MERICKAERMLIGVSLLYALPSNGQHLSIPRRKKQLDGVPAGSSEDVGRAVKAAEKAWPLTPMERAAAMNRFADAIAARADEILRIEVSDTGNTIRPM